MSQIKKIRVYFKTQDGKKTAQDVDTDKTVDRMIANFLEKKKLLYYMNDFSFIVNSIPLTKDKFLNKKVKHIPQLKPDCIIQVRNIGGVSGSSQANH